MKKKLDIKIILLGLILVFAFSLRIYNLGVPALWIDEATSSIASEEILEKGVPLFDSGLLYSRAYTFHYIQAFFLLFGKTEFLARLPSVIFGLLTVLLAYFFGKEYSKQGGLISALFMAVFYLEVFFSRQARFYQLFQLMFFLSIYLLYKSKKNKNYIYPALISFIITLDVQIEGLVLAPFFIGHILFYSKKWNKFLAIIPTIPLVQKLVTALGLSSGSVDSSLNYAQSYISYTLNMIYLLILFVPGLIWSYIKKKRLTVLIMAPSLILLIGIFSLKTFALRYSYFFVFPIIIFSSLLISYLYEKYGKVIFVMALIMLILPSNLFFPQTYINVIKPIDYSFNDYTAPFTDYKNLPENLVYELKNPDNTIISYFSSDVEWYIRKPDYALPFTMDGRGYDQISMNNSRNEIVDRYSGALILKERPLSRYYLLADKFSVSKLVPEQREFLDELIIDCELLHDKEDLKVYYC